MNVWDSTANCKDEPVFYGNSFCTENCAATVFPKTRKVAKPDATAFDIFTKNYVFGVPLLCCTVFHLLQKNIIHLHCKQRQNFLRSVFYFQKNCAPLQLTGSAAKRKFGKTATKKQSAGKAQKLFGRFFACKAMSLQQISQMAYMGGQNK